MHWAIDVGNTQTVFGLWHEEAWQAVFRFSTPVMGTEDELAAGLISLLAQRGLEFKATRFAIASVAPTTEEPLVRLAREWLSVEPMLLRSGEDFGISISYQPANAVGADRLANARGALALFEPPFVVVDFGTATTFDVVDSSRTYIGGAILPGPETLMDSLTSKTAKLPKVPIELPDRAIGVNTPHALQSGIMLGYVGAIEAIARGIREELAEGEGKVPFLVTGGLGEKMVTLCPSLDRYLPTLTLDGIRLASE